MKGARPSLLTPSVVHQRSRFLKEMCHRMDIVCVARDIFVLFLWWPDLAGSRRLRPEAMAYFEDVLQILQLLVKAVAWKLENDFPGQFGLSEQQALGIQSWYTSLPLVGQLKPLLEKLSLGWNTPDKLTHGPPMFALDIQSTPSMSEASTVLDDDDDAHAIDEPNLSTTTMADLVKGWSKSQESRLLLATKERYPSLDILEENEKVKEFQVTLQQYMQSKKQEWIQKVIREGGFVAIDGESTDDTWVRFWRQINRERIARSYHEDSRLHTCCFCSTLVNKTPQAGGIIKLANHGRTCVNGSTLTPGWSMLEGSWGNYFPGGNLFSSFIASLPTNMAINTYQLAAAFVQHLRANDSHPQARVLVPKFQDLFDAIVAFEKVIGSAQGRKLTTFKQGFRTAILKYKTAHDILTLERVPFSQELRRFGKRAKGTLYVFFPLEW
ncbi:hypothetical protein Unana1_08039 [Umbelopsis nana]